MEESHFFPIIFCIEMEVVLVLFLIMPVIRKALHVIIAIGTLFVHTQIRYYAEIQQFISFINSYILSHK